MANAIPSIIRELQVEGRLTPGRWPRRSLAHVACLFVMYSNIKCLKLILNEEPRVIRELEYKLASYGYKSEMALKFLQDLGFKAQKAELEILFPKNETQVSMRWCDDLVSW